MVYTSRNDLLSGLPSALSEPRKISVAGGSVSFSPVVVLAGRVNISCAPFPCWWTDKSLIATGIGGEGGCGSPGAPQPIKPPAKKRIEDACHANCSFAKERRPFLFSIFS